MSIHALLIEESLPTPESGTLTLFLQAGLGPSPSLPSGVPALSATLTLPSGVPALSTARRLSPLTSNGADGTTRVAVATTAAFSGE